AAALGAIDRARPRRLELGHARSYQPGLIPRARTRRAGCEPDAADAASLGDSLGFLSRRAAHPARRRAASSTDGCAVVRDFPAPMPPRGTWILVLLMALGACGSDTVEEPEPPAPRHAEPRMRRLLAKQYVTSIRALLGPAAAAVAKPPPDIASQGFDAIGAADLTPGEPALVAYEQSAQAIANRVVFNVAELPALMGCTPSGVQDRKSVV